MYFNKNVKWTNSVFYHKCSLMLEGAHNRIRQFNAACMIQLLGHACIMLFKYQLIVLRYNSNITRMNHNFSICQMVNLIFNNTSLLYATPCLCNRECLKTHVSSHITSHVSSHVTDLIFHFLSKLHIT